MLRYVHLGVDIISCDCSEEELAVRIKNRLDSMISYHNSLDINDTKFLASRLILGECIILNLSGFDYTVHLKSYNKNARLKMDKFSL